MKVEIRINDKLWIEIELEDALGNSMHAHAQGP